MPAAAPILRTVMSAGKKGHNPELQIFYMDDSQFERVKASEMDWLFANGWPSLTPDQRREFRTAFVQGLTSGYSDDPRVSRMLRAARFLVRMEIRPAGYFERLK